VETETVAAPENSNAAFRRPISASKPDHRPAEPDPANPAPATVSFVVPVLNEAGSIETFLASLRACCRETCEIVVVDGGSEDRTAQLAEAGSDVVITAPRGRAAQMNAGARKATGSILCFVHADSQLPDHADQIIGDALSRQHRQWGRFDVRLSGRHPLLRVVEASMNLRSRLTGIATGDQSLFVRRETFDAVGGFPPIALMEDIAISRKLKSAGPPVCLRQRLTTSSRRWEIHGIVRTIVLMWKLRLLFFLGTDPADLAKRYYGRNG
jgi:rSAM/selenodomain-associated transferase 2